MIYRSKIGIESRGVSTAGSGFLPRSPVYDNDTMMGLCSAQTAFLLSDDDWACCYYCEPHNVH